MTTLRELNGRVVDVLTIARAASFKVEELEGTTENSRVFLVMENEQSTNEYSFMFHSPSNEFRCLQIPLKFSKEQILDAKVKIK